MAEAWDKKVFDFLKKTGDEIKTETQRLIEEVKDPEKQAKIKTGLKDLSVWAKKTAEEAAELVEGAYRKAEETVRQTVPGVRPEDARPKAAAPREEAPAPAPKPKAGAPAGKKPAAKKTVGKKTTSPSSSGAAKPKAKAGVKKTLGKKGRPGGEEA